MTRTRRVTTKLVKLKIACETLAICRDTFWVKWHAVFTDPRPKEDRRHGCERKVFEDELSVALEEGINAVKTFRRTMGRL
ncbi:hypothetical protein VT84_13760 [Gemmata sp. SH-PL17]|uniref:hypothetical protein n=1 Tax=Gemmata sp. SH-PL17 TaxID=1630693 RepID=UPI00078B1738|nr:hypothetical protein [Gemmata sp. SH-PL17]AMV25459.1 hypothetical protein VT84_13760 [Gemmata sp. SH-PL17]